MTDETATYRGRLVLTGNGEADDLLGILDERTGDEVILAEAVLEDAPAEPYTVTVRYFLTDTSVEADDLEAELAKVATGDGDVEYGMRYSDVTGYLWTDEELRVGGHDLLKELKGGLGKWLHLEVAFHAGEG